MFFWFFFCRSRFTSYVHKPSCPKMKNEAFFTMVMSKLQPDGRQAETCQFLELD
eukprot:UN01552